MQTNFLIQFKKVSFGYTQNNTTINNVSFDIKKNEFICIFGLNGSGKSTLAKMIVGLYKPKYGSIYFNNKLITKENYEILQKEIAYANEYIDAQLFGKTVRENIACNINNSFDCDSVIHSISNMTNINDILDKNCNDLSSGQKQKVIISSLLARKSNVIVFDETINMLDNYDKKIIFKLILRLNKEYKKTIILISHDIEVANYADKIMILENGKIINFDQPFKIFKENNTLNNFNKPLIWKLRDKINNKSLLSDKFIKKFIYEKF